ncbi:uncharacterized protein LOC127581298 [Pristis pectinata]|uniref:uncharacterized protein LOC127581298 n=1 Tax=Pristis pectinata TaxID=685728 RepID=UPI00223D5440|nr:uncharacterized protein LOC127581298 [Pristis pectinata]
MLHCGRDVGDWTRKVMAVGGRRCDRGLGNTSGSMEADVRQGPVGRWETNGRRAAQGARSVGGAPAPCPPSLGQGALSRVIAAQLEPRLPLLPVRGSARWGPTKVGGRAVGRLSQILAVLPFYTPLLKPANVSSAETLGKKYPSLKPSEMAGSMKMAGDCAPWAGTLGDNDTYTTKGFTNCGKVWSCPVFYQGVNDNYRSGLWIRTFQRLISSNASALLQDSNRYRHCHSTGMKALQQCRMYGYYKDDESYFGKNNAVPLPRGNNTVYYSILKVSPNATHSQIKSAYYKQSFIYHPDRNAGSEEAALRFTQINEAYSVLGSVSLRKKYDRGILTPADLHIGKKPSDKGQASTIKQTKTGSSEEKLNDGKSNFNFDEFYKAHYGRQLEMEQLLRQRRMQLRKSRENFEKRWNLQKLIEMIVIVMLITGFLILFSFRSK